MYMYSDNFIITLYATYLFSSPSENAITAFRYWHRLYMYKPAV